MLVKTQYVTFDKELKLQSGAVLGPITLAYETYGELNPDKSNAILILHALSGDAHVAGKHAASDTKPGWWDEAVGPGKAFDTDKYFVICSNVIGGCKGSTGPSSTDPKTGKLTGKYKPMVEMQTLNTTTGDMATKAYTPEDAVKKMKDTPDTWGKLFRSGVVSGIGAGTATGGLSPGQGGRLTAAQLRNIGSATQLFTDIFHEGTNIGAFGAIHSQAGSVTFAGQ